MRGRRHLGACVLAALLVSAALGTTASARADARDDTSWLQAKLDAGGAVFLPKLPDGRCYATRGLWVSRDDTSITSDGACIVALGFGEARIPAIPRPVRANAVFFVSHSSIFGPQPVRVTISGFHIVVPAATRMAGIGIYGHEITVDHVAVSGAPMTDVVVGSGAPGAAGPIERVSILDSTLLGGKRDVVAAYGAIGLDVERNTLSGGRSVRNRPPAAGLHISSAERGQPTLNVRVADNTISGNAGPGIMVDLDPRDGPPVLASGIEITGNHVLGNAREASRSRRAGIVLTGGQDDGAGRLAVTDNVVRGNRGPGILGRDLRVALTNDGNDLRGNVGGAAKGLRIAAQPNAPSGSQWRPSPSILAGAGHDDTAWLQARLDARGGTIFLPKLPDGACYATRGLWVSHDDTTITSDGACIVSLGPGDVRLHSVDGDPIAANGVFFVNRSRSTKPTPVRVTISNLQIVVPSGQSMYGIAVFGHHTTLSNLDILGAPIDDVLIGGRANGNGYVENVAVLDSRLGGAGRNAISAFGVIGLRIEGDTVAGVRDSPPGQPAAGVDIEPDDRSQPTLGLRIVDNTFEDNAGPGILLVLDSNSGAAVIASDMEITGNTIVRNAQKRTPPTRAGVAVEGGQDGGAGTLVLKDNVIHDNGGPGILMRSVNLVVQQSGNDLSGNEGG